ncbi:MAG: HK97 family phage prohead protease [Lachnospiraceae bacterium]|nr:HK97 family phage prohead protease [Lachnospiraceae bacterium]
MATEKTAPPAPMTMEQNRANPQHREMPTASIRAMEGEGNERKFTLSFSSEEPYERFWGIEILDHAEGAVDLTRLNEIGVLLFNHDRDAVVGKVNRAWLENNRGYAEVEFDTDEASEVICQKVRNGTLKRVPVGYRIDTIEQVLAGKTTAEGRVTGPAEIVRKWWPYEISIVSVPADGTVGVGREIETITPTPIEVYERQLQINKSFIGGNEP